MLIPSALPSDNYETLYNVATEARRSGDTATALSAVERILEQDPTRAGALYLRGLLALDSGQFEAAQSWIARAIEVNPHADFYTTLSAIQLKSEAYTSALHTARQGLALRPASVELRFYEAGALFLQGRPDEAALSYKRLLELEPNNLPALTNLGIVLKDLDELDDAERYLRRAMALASDNRSARGHLATVLLATGRYEEGWACYEDRWANFVTPDGKPSTNARPSVPLPQWRGERVGSGIRSGHTPEFGARLLVIPEQGLGDSLQFARYLPLALEHFSEVGFVCPQPLRRLFDASFTARWPSIVMMDSLPARFGDWDRHCPTMSLPMAFGTRIDSIPATSYLFADPARAARWHDRLATLPDPDLPRVGIVWAGGHSGVMEDKARSMTSAQFAPIFALPGIHWISLQKTDDPAKRADTASQSRLTDWTDELTDFADTAALIENLDLVIAVDTSVAHLAAAMGKPVWILNRFAGCWRWLRYRDDSPWYPTVRLFNQQQAGDWGEVLMRVGAALQEWREPANPIRPRFNLSDSKSE